MSFLGDFLHKAMTIRMALAGIFFTALTLVKTFPLITHFHTHFPGAFGDPVLVTWILAWGVHALTTNPWNLFNANIFYPVQNTLALSEHMIAVVPIFAAVYLPTGSPIVAYNSVFFLSFILCGMAMFLLVHHWTENFWASLVAGCLFAFAPIRFAEIYHLQLYNFYWAPLVLLYLDKFLSTKRWRDLAGFAVFYWLQMLTSVYLGWLITVAVGVYVAYVVIRIDRGLLGRVLVPRLAACIVGSLIVLLPFHLPYYAIKQQWNFSTPLQECIFWAADPLVNYLSPPDLFNDAYLAFVQSYLPRLHHPDNQQMLFPGFILGFLTVVGSLGNARCLPFARAVQLQRLFRAILIVTLLLSLGPFLVIFGTNTGVPLPYLVLYYLIPGFQAMRVPGRFALLASLAASVLAGLGFLRSSDFVRGRWKYGLQGLLAVLWIGLFLLELGFKPLPLANIPTGQDVPEVYRWLASNEPAGPIVELPLGESFRQALTYMYFSTYHWRPLVNGTSRFMPPTHTQLNAELMSLPSFEAVGILNAIGVKAVVVHTDLLTPQEAARWHDADLATIGLAEVARFGSDVVYRLFPSETVPQGNLALAIPDRQPNGGEVVLPAGARMRFGLIVESGAQQPWVHPPPFGRTHMRLKWEKVPTGAGHMQREKVGLPLVLRAGEVWSTGVPTKIPSAPGLYRFSLDVPTLDLKAPSKLIQVSEEASQTSATTSESLSAAYTLEEPPSTHPITSPIIDVTLLATNTGQVVWLAEADHDRGKVRLGWRWLKGGTDLPFKEGREDLRYDVFPGQEYRFKARINAPPEPGEYVLELGLVCELLTWFSDRGVAPLKFVVQVQSVENSPSR